MLSAFGCRTEAGPWGLSAPAPPSTGSPCCVTGRRAPRPAAERRGVGCESGSVPGGRGGAQPRSRSRLSPYVLCSLGVRVRPLPGQSEHACQASCEWVWVWVRLSRGRSGAQDSGRGVWSGRAEKCRGECADMPCQGLASVSPSALRTAWGVELIVSLGQMRRQRPGRSFPASFTHSPRWTPAHRGHLGYGILSPF